MKYQNILIPLKDLYNFLIPPQAGLQTILTPLTYRTPSTAGLKMKNLLSLQKCLNFSHEFAFWSESEVNKVEL